MPETSREIRLARQPGAHLSVNDFEMIEVPLPRPAEGEVLVRNTWMSIDPYMRLRLRGRPGFPAAVQAGSVMIGGAVGVVERSRASSVPEGALVTSARGWRERFVAPASEVEAIDQPVGRPSLYLGLLGLTGIAAYAGVEFVLEPKAGDTVFVSSAAGAVGSVACQLAKARGARVLGSAGSSAKLAWLTSALGVDATVNYRSESVADFLQREAPQGLDAYFDNVGGATLDAALLAMRRFGRIAVCGAIAQYETDAYRSGPKEFFSIVEKSLRLGGCNWADYRPQSKAIIADLSTRLSNKALVSHEQVLEGLESAVPGLVSLFDNSADHLGKLVVRLSS